MAVTDGFSKWRMRRLTWYDTTQIWNESSSEPSVLPYAPQQVDLIAVHDAVHVVRQITARLKDAARPQRDKTDSVLVLGYLFFAVPVRAIGCWLHPGSIAARSVSSKDPFLIFGEQWHKGVV